MSLEFHETMDPNSVDVVRSGSDRSRHIAKLQWHKERPPSIVCGAYGFATFTLDEMKEMVDELSARSRGRRSDTIPVTAPTNQYTSLQDAAAIDPRYGHGPGKVWYAKPGATREVGMVTQWLKDHGLLPSLSPLTQAALTNYVCIGNVDTESPEDAYELMQGENWSPEGQARSLIASLGLSHTTMSVGDLFEVNGKLFFVDRTGFVSLPV